MGLISEGDKYAILSDIIGDEDHLGDMDFKVCGTEKGITAIQMDIKIKGLSRDVMVEALDQAREGRQHILDKMLETIPGPRPELNKFAPRIVTLKVKPDQIRTIIGPGGKTIKGIVDQTGANIDVEDDGTVNVASNDEESLRKTVEIIEGLTAEPEIGKVYDGVVRRVADFGAFVEILPNWDGLVHISELAHGRIDRVEDVCREGDPLVVKVLSVEDGKVRLSHRETLPPPEGGEERDGDRSRRPRDRSGPRTGGPGRSDRSSGSRGGPRGDRSRGPSSRDRDDRRRGSSSRDRGDRSRGPSPRDRDDRPRGSSGRDRDDRPRGSSSRDRDDRPQGPSSRDREERPTSSRSTRTRRSVSTGVNRDRDQDRDRDKDRDRDRDRDRDQDRPPPYRRRSE